MVKHRFRKTERLKTHADFTRCYREGERLRTMAFTVYAYRRGPGVTRLGLTVGKAVGTAVIRNRLKRRLRELFRLHKTLVPAGYDLCIRAAPASARARYQELEAAFCQTLAKLGSAEISPELGPAAAGVAQ